MDWGGGGACDRTGGATRGEDLTAGGGAHMRTGPRLAKIR